MSFAAFSRDLNRITQPQHPYYHPVQASLFAGISYMSTKCLTSIPPKRGMSLALLAYAISQFVAPLFGQLLEPHQEVSLVPFIGQVLNLTTTLVLAKGICGLIGYPLSFQEIRKVAAVFLTSLFVARLALLKFRKQLNVQSF